MTYSLFDIFMEGLLIVALIIMALKGEYVLMLLLMILIELRHVRIKMKGDL